MFESFTQESHKITNAAKDLADATAKDCQLSALHLVLSTLINSPNSATILMEKMGIDINGLKEYVYTVLEAEPIKKNNDEDKEILSNIFKGALLESGSLNIGVVSPEFILLSILRNANTSSGAEALKLFGATLGSLQKAIKQDLLLNTKKTQKKNELLSDIDSETIIKSPNLDRYAINLTAMAKAGKIDPVFGREDETQRMINVMSLRRKNNPLLLGEPGVGKTAVVEDLARRIVEGRVPKYLLNKQIYSLDVSLLMAGARFRGDFEERLNKVLKELKNRTDAILFVDEIHTLMGAGRASEDSGLDAANIIKPILARGEVSIIGATTYDEYKKYIETDAAIARRFRTIKIEEPSVENTIKILQGIKSDYESFHNVKITDDAISYAATASARYIHDRFLPDKAIDLLDEASATVKIRKESSDLETDNIETELNEDESNPNNDVANFPVVDQNDVAAIIAKMTGLPATKITTTENEKLALMETKIEAQVIGQDHAVKTVVNAIKRGRTGLNDPNRPLGSFIFAGPTGVGKTELSLALTENLLGDKNSLISLDMSEFAEPHSISRLLGSPPGYIGYKDANGNSLAEQVRRKPFSVILFDEIEKAHPSIFNVLLQILDKGILTTSDSKLVSFKDTVIIMTTNLGWDKITKDPLGFNVAPSGENQYAELVATVMPELKQNFKPEFLNRVDEVVVFPKLTTEHMVKIVSIFINKLKERIATKNISLTISPTAENYLATKGYDPNLGARPLRRLIQDEIENPLSQLIIEGELIENQNVKIDCTSDKLSFTVQPLKVTVNA